jgi:hypothetical protein
LQKALAGYLESGRRGEVHYWHHLADYYADVGKDGSQAVVWARRDLQLRANFSTQAALARLRGLGPFFVFGPLNINGLG